jgi:hypothetical protein
VSDLHLPSLGRDGVKSRVSRDRIGSITEGEIYGRRQIFGVDKEAGFEKEGEKGGIGKGKKIL